MAAKRCVNQYTGALSAEQIVEGMNAAAENARRLYQESERLLDAGSFPTAACLAALVFFVDQVMNGARTLEGFRPLFASESELPASIPGASTLQPGDLAGFLLPLQQAVAARPRVKRGDFCALAAPDAELCRLGAEPLPRDGRGSCEPCGLQAAQDSMARMRAAEVREYVLLASKSLRASSFFAASASPSALDAS